jgi:hypothetical protein
VGRDAGRAGQGIWQGAILLQGMYSHLVKTPGVCLCLRAGVVCVCVRGGLLIMERQGECVIGLAGWQPPKRMPSMRQQLQHCMMRQQHQRCLLVAGTDGQRGVLVCILFVGTSSFLPNCCCQVFRLSVCL